MRVIAGKARRLQLKTVKGTNTRPTTDRIKETLFNIIGYDIEKATFLDLFSGSGAIGIEALSRGAREVYFIENDKAALQCIKDNLQFTKLEDGAFIIPSSFEVALKKLESKNCTFDFVFMDPPYNQSFEKEVLILLSQSTLIDKNTKIIVEASLETDFSYISDLELEIKREKKYKTNKHVFLEVSGD